MTDVPRRLSRLLLILLAVTGCALPEGDTTPPHNLELDSLGDHVLDPIPLYQEPYYLSDAEIEANAEAYARGEHVPSRAGPWIRPPDVVHRTVTDIDFVLFEDWGDYTFDVWFGGRPAGETGTVWLEATDEIRGTRLSENLLRRSEMRVTSPPTGFEYFPGKDGNVRIVEGDPGDPYPVVFDLVYKSDGDAPPTTLLTKTYLIEGWAR